MNEQRYRSYEGDWWERGEKPGWREPPGWTIDPGQIMDEIEARYAPRVLPEEGGWGRYQHMVARLAALRWVTGRSEYD